LLGDDRWNPGGGPFNWLNFEDVLDTGDAATMGTANLSSEILTRHTEHAAATGADKVDGQGRLPSTKPNMAASRKVHPGGRTRREVERKECTAPPRR
jgi:hypothetical protein